MNDDVNKSVVSIGKFIGILSIVAPIAAIIYFIAYPIYNGDFLILTEVGVKCLGAIITGYVGFVVSMLIRCLGGLADDVKTIRKVYEITYAKVEEHESKKNPKKETKKMKLPERKVVEEEEVVEKPQKPVKQKKKISQKVADLLLEEEEEQEDTLESVDDDDYIEID